MKVLAIDMENLTDVQMSKVIDLFAEIYGDEFRDMTAEPHTFTLVVETLEDDFEEVEEEFEPLDLEEGVETKWGIITMKHAMIDTDGTNLADGIEIRLDGNLIGEAIGYTSSKIESFETIEDVENFVDKHCDF